MEYLISYFRVSIPFISLENWVNLRHLCAILLHDINSLKSKLISTCYLVERIPSSVDKKGIELNNDMMNICAV